MIAVGMGTTLKLLRDRNGYGMRAVGTIGYGYKYLSPYSSVLQKISDMTKGKQQLKIESQDKTGWSKQEM